MTLKTELLPNHRNDFRKNAYPDSVTFQSELKEYRLRSIRRFFMNH